MIHAYDEYYPNMVQRRLGSMFEIAVYEEKLAIDDFAKRFVQSPIGKAIGEGDPIYLTGKS